MLLVGALPALVPAHAQTSPVVDVRSQYTLNRYGFATVNETVKFINNGSSSAQGPDLTFGFGNLSSKIVAYSLTGSSFAQPPASSAGPFTVSGLSAAAGNSSSYVLSVLLNDVVGTESNGSLSVLTLSSPSLTPGVSRLVNVVQMPTSTAFKSVPAGLKANITGANNAYYQTVSSGQAQTAVTSVRSVVQSNVADFHPLTIYSAERTVTVGAGGMPTVVDKVEFRNRGTSPLTGFYVTPLTTSTAKVTILTQTEPRLLSPLTIQLTNGAIDLSSVAVGYPSSGVQAGLNYTVSYSYALGASYYSQSGGQVTMNIPLTAPIRAFVDSYSIKVSVPTGVKVTQGAPQPMTNLTPWQGGRTALGYDLTPGWGIETAVPGASVIFVLLLLGLFVSRATLTEEEETEEESSTERTSDLIKAFEEKTTLINGLWPEITAKDVNELNKEYFNELRGRLDAFRSRALQRLNEVKQKATTQKFSELLNQIQATEREVDRAAKDKLNLYDQFYMNRMRKEVFDRLLPQYTKRLEKALNQLSDELHLVQREAKLS